VRGAAASGQNPRFALSRQQRLSRKADFEFLLHQGKRRSWRGFVVFLFARSDGPPRLGMLVSRKHSPRATVRNHIKRCIREAFRRDQAKLGAIDLLVRPPYGAKPGAEMTERLHELFARLDT
jgi:ribonuclease P protein component